MSRARLCRTVYRQLRNKPPASSMDAQQMASLEDLPVELLLSITSLCSEEDCSNLRTLGSKYAEAIAPTLFEHFHLCCFEFSLKRLRAIASSSQRKYVKRITFHTKVVHYDYPKEDFEEQVTDALWEVGGDDVETFHPPRSQWPEVLQTYQECRRQCPIFFEHTSRQLLRDAIAALPALEEVTITPFRLFDSDEAVVWQSSKLRPGPVLMLCFIVEPYGNEKDEQCTEWMLDAIARRASQSPRVQVTRVSSIVSLGAAPSSELLDVSQGQGLHDISRALEHIEVLHLIRASEETDKLGQMTTLISCRRLQDLTADCFNPLPDSDRMPVFITPISRTIGLTPTPWPCLRKLSLIRAHLLSDEFNLFVTGHADTLVSLRIVESWSDDFRKVMRHFARILRLQEIHLVQLYDLSCFDEPELRRCKTYFQHGIADDLVVTAWLLGSQEEEPDLRPRMLEDEWDYLESLNYDLGEDVEDPPNYTWRT